MNTDAYPNLEFIGSPDTLRKIRTLDRSERQVLSSSFAKCVSLIPTEWETSLASKEIFWVNVFQSSGFSENVKPACSAELDAWVQRLVHECYSIGTVTLEGYGFVVNPAESQQAQPWHIDYSMGYSTLLIPMSILTTGNSTQYAVIEAPPAHLLEKAAGNPDDIDVDEFVRAGASVCARQLLVAPFSLLKLNFGGIHRGIPNTSGVHRNVFWISVLQKGFSKASEPRIQKFF